MSIKKSLIERYQAAGGSDADVMNSTTRLVKEVGGGSGVSGAFVVEFNYNEETFTYSLNKNYNEIMAAVSSGMPVLAYTTNIDETFGGSIIISLLIEIGFQNDRESYYFVTFGRGQGTKEFRADSAAGTLEEYTGTLIE